MAIFNEQQDPVRIEGQASRALTLKHLWRHCSRQDRILLAGSWLLTLALSIGLGLASIIYSWSGLALNFGGTDIYVTVYPPLIFCTIWVIWFGFWWGFVPAYLATLVLALYSGIPPLWSLLFAFADPLGLAVLALGYRAIPLSPDLRTLNSILFFVLLSFIGGIFGSSGSFIWTHTNQLGVYDVYAIWQGWWLGALLQNLIFVAPVLMLGSAAVKRWQRARQWHTKAKSSRPQVLFAAASVVVGVMGYLYITISLASKIMQKAIDQTPGEQWHRTWAVVAESSQALYLVLCFILFFLGFFGYQLFKHWTRTELLANQKLTATNNYLEKEIRERREIEHQLQQNNQQMTQIISLSVALQGATNLQHASDILANHCNQLFPELSGAICLRNGASFRQVHAWGPLDLPCPSSLPEDIAEQADGNFQPMSWQDGNNLCGGYILPLVINDQLEGAVIWSEIPFPLSDMPQLQQVLAENLTLSFSNLILKEQLTNQASIDPLTGAFNRRYMQQFLLDSLSQARNNEEVLSVLLIDLDHFKQVNDRYGHDTGDLVLKLLTQNLIDALPSHQPVCRIGGEEFLIIAPNYPKRAATELADYLLTRIRQLKVESPQQSLSNITASIGVASFAEDGDSDADLLKAADIALYEAKTSGRNRVVSFTKRL